MPPTLILPNMLPKLARLTSTVFALAIAAPSIALSQVPAPVQSSAPVAAKGWRAAPSFSVETEYDDNVFLLSPGKRDDLDAMGDVTSPSRRFDDMKSPGDLVSTMEARLDLKGPGLRGRTLELQGDVRYELYARNAERQNFSVELAAEQALRHGKQVRLRASVTPSYFAKNYLADAADSDADGSIAPDERVYEAGTYQEIEGQLDVRFRLVESTKQHPFGAAIQPSVGLYSRSYEAPFSGRDLSGPTAGVKLLMDISPRMGLDVGYGFASLSATPSRQVMILDEAAFGEDFNGNGSASDPAARAFEMADRSRTEHSIAATLRYEVGKRADLEIDADHRRRSFGSSQPFDVANNGRTDSRNTFGAELAIKVARGVRLVAGAEVRSQRLSRDNDPDSTGEIADYDKHRTRLGLSYRF